MLAAVLFIPIIIIQAIFVTLVICKLLYWKTLYHYPNLFEGGKRVVAFFHPYCNAGGGGERVLWTAIRAIHQQYPDVYCVVYTGDDVSDHQILQRARDRFNISITKPVTFVHLKLRWLVEASTWPRFTLLGQSFGSMLLALEAMYRFIPHIYIDTMGYAFTLPLLKYMASCKVACYVHYPTISTDMLEVVSSQTRSFNNANFISRSRNLTRLKLVYYRIFARVYGWCGCCSDVVMVNSSWTSAHIRCVWRVQPHVVYPPCDTSEFLSLPRLHHQPPGEVRVLSVAQFRPEKDHPLQLESVRQVIERVGEQQRVVLVLAGGCRDKEDEERVDKLKALAKKLEIEQNVEFKLNIPFNELKDEMSKALIGLHTMRNEHFGIGVVELQAAGTLVVAHDSGGPQMDIVVKEAGVATGFLADSPNTYCEHMCSIIHMPQQERDKITAAARNSVLRFSEEKFERTFLSLTKSMFDISNVTT